MNGHEVVWRHSHETIYRVARKTNARLRARDLIPPAIVIPPADAALIEAAGGNVDDVIARMRAECMKLRVAKWWDEHAGPLIRRLQAAMYEKLREHVARRQASIWRTGPMTITVDGQVTDVLH